MFEKLPQSLTMPSVSGTWQRSDGKIEAMSTTVGMLASEVKAATLELGRTL